MQVIFKWLRPGREAVPLDAHDAEEPDVSDLKLLPDTQSLADRLKACLQVGGRNSVCCRYIGCSGSVASGRYHAAALQAHRGLARSRIPRRFWP